MSSTVVQDVLDVITISAKEIREGLVGRRGDVNAKNPSGEIQAEADVWADQLLLERMSDIDGVSEYASEERTGIIDCGDGGISVAVDPLDGSSNLKSNNTMGTIFGIYDQPLPAPGSTLIGAGYVLYGPITTMTYAYDDMVRTCEISTGQRTVVEDDVSIPDDPLVYGFGGRVPSWPADFEAFARTIEQELKLRYGGAMIGDVNQVMTYGGIFAYPALRDHPNGKLRLQFEGNPIGYIIEAAGGRSSDGSQSLLEVTPTDLHSRVPVHVGTTSLIDRLESALG